MGKGVQSPTPPDPTVVSAAQTASNKETALYQQQLNMVGTTGPTGSVNYVADTTQPGGYRQVTSLSPAEQATYDRTKQAQNGALDTANTQLGRVNAALATPLNTDGLPALSGSITPQGTRQFGFDVPTLQTGYASQNTFNNGQPLQYGFNQGQQVQGQVGPQDLSAASKQAQDAAYSQATSRLDPQFTQSEEQLRNQLANQGLSQNSDAYRTALDSFSRGKNDAYSTAQNQSVTQGNAAAQQLFDQSLNQGQFANQAAGQQYTQNQGQAAFNNQTAGQDFSQNQQAAQFYNDTNANQAAFGNNAAATQAGLAAQSAQVNNSAVDSQRNTQIQLAQLQNTARNQGLQERAYIQNQPINQFTGLLGLGQVGQPQGISYTPSQVAPTDVTGAYALQSQAQQANANRAQQASSGMMGGLFSLGSAAMMSDIRLKTDIKLIRRRKDGVGIYRFRYKAGGPMQVGVMAQELKKVRPDLVIKRLDGFLAVDYSGVDLEAA